MGFDQAKKSKKEQQLADQKKAQEARQAEIDATFHKGKKHEFF